MHGSRVLIGAGLLDEGGVELRATLQRRRLAIISDSNVAPLYAARLATACGRRLTQLPCHWLRGIASCAIT